MTRNKLSNWIRTTTLAAAVTMFGAASAQASLTAVKPPNASEMGIEQILAGTYGGNFYAIHGLSNPDTYLLFFEDMDLTANTWKNRSYADYNDLVVQVNRSSATPLAAPLPPAVLTGGLLMAGNGLFALIRKVKKQLI